MEKRKMKKVVMLMLSFALCLPILLMNSVEAKAANEYVLDLVWGEGEYSHKEIRVSEGDDAYRTYYGDGSVADYIPVINPTGTTITYNVEDILSCWFKIDGTYDSEESYHRNLYSDSTYKNELTGQIVITSGVKTTVYIKPRESSWVKVCFDNGGARNYGFQSKDGMMSVDKLISILKDEGVIFENEAKVYSDAAKTTEITGRNVPLSDYETKSTVYVNGVHPESSGNNSGNNSNRNENYVTEKNSEESVALTEAEIHAQKAAEIEARQKKTITTADGTAIKTEIAGVYEVENLSGTAVTTEKTEVLKAMGLSETEISNGANASIYMSGWLSGEDKAVLNDAVNKSGKTALTMLVSDMYMVTKEGEITKLNNIPNPISLMLGLPKYAADAQRNYSVLCVQPDGSYVECKDMDDDPSTITINTNVFGKYVIVY